jgi:hypothetical protein
MVCNKCVLFILHLVFVAFQNDTHHHEEKKRLNVQFDHT